MKPDELSARLAKIESQGLYRRRRVVEETSGARVVLEGKQLLNFCSNNYLGLADHPKLIEVMREAAAVYGVGSGASHLVCGHTIAHHALEEELAEFTGRERAILFSTGYMANQGVISALVGRGEWVFEDRLNHASLLDGALLSGARLKRYAHCSIGDLQAQMNECSAEGRILVSDGVFSMDGDMAPVPDLARLAKQANAWLMVDDAHGLGVVGQNGGGTLEYFGLSAAEVPVLMCTLGKAFGTFGAFVAGSRDLIEYLIQCARPYIYSTALPPSVAEATRASLRLVREEIWRRDKLQVLIQRFRRGAEQLGLPLLPSHTPIQPILIGGNHEAVVASQKLLEAGYLVTAIRPPTVPMGTARLRITLSAVHEESEVDCLLDILANSLSRPL